MSPARNVIGKQCIDISFEGETDAFVFRDQVSWVCSTKLLPAIEKLLDERSPQRKIYHFDKLVIDTGDLPRENWETLFVEKVIAQLLSHVSVTSSSFAPTHFLDDKRNRGREKGNGMREVRQRESIKQTIYYFLETGQLPWNTSITTKEGLNEALVQMIHDGKALKELLQLFASNEHVLQRLAQQFDKEVLDKIIFLSVDISDEVLTELKGTLEALFRLVNISSFRQRQMKYEILLRSISAGGSIHKDNYLSMVIEDVFREIPVVDLMQIFGFQHADINNSIIDALRQRFSEITSSEPIREKIQWYFQNKVLGNDRKGSVKNNGKDLEKNNPGSSSPINEKSEEVFISNAGLVLLHPFLQLLFENVGYTDKKEWLTDETRKRAIALTQYMVTGSELSPEFDLVLNKILTGHPVEQTLPADIILSDFEKQEADDVLRSVIKHWPALKNTTIEGLRSSFLKRDGKIFNDESGVNLKVMQKTIDILMNRLPWGLSMVKTPWMKKMLKVEWT